VRPTLLNKEDRDQELMGSLLCRPWRHDEDLPFALRVLQAREVTGSDWGSKKTTLTAMLYLGVNSLGLGFHGFSSDSDTNRDPVLGSMMNLLCLISISIK
jgi:hypothetical protein